MITEEVLLFSVKNPKETTSHLTSEERICSCEIWPRMFGVTFDVKKEFSIFAIFDQNSNTVASILK